MLIKAGREKEFRNLADEILIPEARKIRGCLLFSLFQNTSNPQEFIFYELWQSKQDVSDYKKRLVEVLGKNDPGSEFPIKLNDFFEEDEDLI